MKLSWKAGVALLLAGITLGGVGSSFAAENRSDDRRGPGPRHKMMFAGPMVRSTAIVEGDTEGTFKTIKADSGELTAIDGNTLTIKEADGQVVQITVSDQTEYGREGEESSKDALKVGDHVFVHRVDDVTEHVGSMSAERYAEMEARREACEADESKCERPEHRRFRGPGAPGDGEEEGDVEPAPAAGAVFMESVDS